MVRGHHSISEDLAAAASRPKRASEDREGDREGETEQRETEQRETERAERERGAEKRTGYGKWYGEA